jgi:CBS domain-containing protein
MQVKEIMRIKGNTLYSAAPDTMLSDCVILMADNDIGSLVVMDKGKLIGMVTFREVIKILAKRQIERRTGPTPTMAEIRVEEVMDRDPIIVAPDTEVDELRRNMLEHHSRYVPVMEGEAVLGVVSFHDVAKAVLEEQGFENRMLKGYIKNWPA